MKVDPQKTLAAIQKIDEILSQFRDYFPAPIKIIKNEKVEDSMYHLKLLKRVSGIIKGYNEENAIMKASNLVKLFDALRKRN